MTGAELICRVFKDEGVKYVFGVPGSTEVPVMDAIAQDPDITYISAVHEAVSTGMADGYARASGGMGVVMVHTAPGTSNVIGNLYTAHAAGTPMLVIGGKQDTRLKWSDCYLDADLLPMVSSFTKACWEVNHAHELPVALRRAFKEATTPPTGPVFLGIPRDLQEQTIDVDLSLERRRRMPEAGRPDREQLREVAGLLLEAERPAILAGRQVADVGAVTELVRLAELLSIPVYATAQIPKLVFPTSHPLYYNRILPIGFQLAGLDGPADVVLAIGSYLFKQILYMPGPLLPPGMKMVQIDSDPAGLSRDCPADIALLASPKLALAELADEIERIMSDSQREAAKQRFTRLKQARDEATRGREEQFKDVWDQVPIHPWRAVSDMIAALPHGSIIVDEAVMLTTYLEYLYETADVSGYFSANACLGWGLPAALGVSLAAQGRQVVAMVGDGATLFGLQALWTAARYELPVVFVVLNNSGYNAIKWAFAAYPMRGCSRDADLGCELGNVDFPAVAGGFGVQGERIENPDEVRPAFERAVASGKPRLLDIMLDPKDVGCGLPRLP